MPKVKVGDINLYYEVYGHGQPLVLIMGYQFGSSAWWPVIPGLSHNYQVVIFDNRGAGQSDKPDIPYTMEMMANDLVGLLDAIDINTANIFGLSMGGMIAQNFALKHPKRVANLILGSTYTGGLHAVKWDAAADAILFDFEHAKKLTPQERFNELISVLLSQEFIKNNRDVIQDLAKKMIAQPPNPLGVMRQAQAIMMHDTWARLPEIKAPTLIIHGDADRAIPVENARILASRISNAETVILPGKGHGLNIEAIPEMNRAVLSFLDKH
jgi:pimeloyl-ACP methyl ester carboxylesterase